MSLTETQGDRFLQRVIQSYREPEVLSSLFSQAEDIHLFLQQQMVALAQIVSPGELQLITSALEQQKDERLKKESRYFVLQAFQHSFHGRFRRENSNPGMKADPDALIADIQGALVKEITLVTDKLKDMLPGEQIATDSQDWQYIRKKSCSVALLEMMKEYLDDPSLVKANLHYFTGHDLSEKILKEEAGI